MIFSKTLSMFLLLVAASSACVDAATKSESRNVRRSSSSPSLVGRVSSSSISSHRFMAEDEEESAETVETTSDTASYEDEDGDEDEEETKDKSSRKKAMKEPVERECEIDSSKDEVTFKCKAKTEDDTSDTELKDEIKFKIKYEKDEGLTVKVEYEQEVETSDTETESETQYVVNFEKVIEYEKTSSGGINAYDWESDLIVKEFPLTADVKYEFGEIVDDGTKAMFSVTTLDELGMGIAEFTFTISRGGMNEEITANKMKIDFELMNYEWAQDNTYIALLSSIKTDREIKVERDGKDDDSDDGAAKATTRSSMMADEVVISFADILDTEDIPVFGEFTWAKDAVVRTLSNVTFGNETDATAVSRSGGGLTSVANDARKIEVIATSPRTVDTTSEGGRNRGREQIAFSFVGDAVHLANDIYWDPSAGVGYDDSSSASSRLAPASLMMMGATILSTAFMYLCL